MSAPLPDRVIRRLLRDLRVGTKLALIVGLLIAGVSIFILVYFPAHQEQESLRGIAELGQSVADMTSFSIVPALLFGDKQTMEESFSAARQNKNLAFMVLVNARGESIHSYEGRLLLSSDSLRIQHGNGLSATGEYYVVAVPVLFETKPIGRLYVGLSMAQARLSAEETRVEILQVSIIVFLVGVIAAWAIGIVFTAPMRRMAQVAAEVTRGNLSVRAAEAGSDEAGVLAGSFNIMLDRLASTLVELEEMNKTLEVRVERRTSELKEAEAKYRGIFENAAVGIYRATLDGRINAANPTFARLLGFAGVEEMQRSCILDGSFYLRPGRKEELLEAIRTSDVLSDFESQVRTASGRVIWISENVIGVKDAQKRLVGLDGSVRDISRRKGAEELSLRLQRAVEETDEIVMMIDPHGKLTYVNPAFERLYGYRKEEVMGLSPLRLRMEPIGSDDEAAVWRTIISGRTNRGEEVYTRNGGGKIIVSTSINPVHDAAGNLVGFIGVQTDITERKRADEERMRLHAELAHAQKIESIGTLAGGIAHDFNNLLSIIVGHAGLIEGDEEACQQTVQSVQAINSAVERGAGLVKQILTFARKSAISLEAVSLNVVVREMVGIMKETFPKTIDIATRLTDSSAVIRGDRSNLNQTVLNLCVNARDAMPHGGTLTVTTSDVDGADVRMRFAQATADRYFLMTVGDTGSGMDPEVRERIFEPFFTTKEQGKGTGLGLSVVHGIVESHGGFIAVESEEGRGTIFSVYFPIVSGVGPAQDAATVVEGGRPGRGETLLVVEDEAMLRALLNDALIKNGYRVILAADGNEGLVKFKEHRHEIALVLTDIGLPKLSGHDLFRAIRDIDPAAKVLVASGYLEPQVRADILRSGALGVIAKPYMPRHLGHIVREAIDQAPR
jgi:two-component system, cell cycle sensor histidine kinase and response regulator CckA